MEISFCSSTCDVDMIIFIKPTTAENYACENEHLYKPDIQVAYLTGEDRNKKRESIDHRRLTRRPIAL